MTGVAYNFNVFSTKRVSNKAQRIVQVNTHMFFPDMPATLYVGSLQNANKNQNVISQVCIGCEVMDVDSQ